METGHFPLFHEFLGRLYCLITWQGSFNSRPRPVYFGMGRISPWVELLGWVFASTPFIRWRSGLASVVYALGLHSEPVHMLFSTPSILYVVFLINI